MRSFLAARADPAANLNRVVGGLVFRMESGLVQNRLIWEEASKLRHAADMIRVGLPPDAVPEGLSILRDEIDLLNRCRVESAPDYLR
jgi:hypothetical protein